MGTRLRMHMHILDRIERKLKFGLIYTIQLYHKSLQHPTTKPDTTGHTIVKPDKFDPSDCFKSGFVFSRNDRKN